MTRPDDTAPIVLPTQAPPRVRSHGSTDKGKVRSSNEDQFLIGELARTLWVRQTSLPQPETQHGRNRAYVFLVADGMGGHRAGEVASAMTVASIEAYVLHILKRFSNLQTADEPTVLKDFRTALREADARLAEESAHHPEFAGMGTTLTMAFTSGWKLWVFHAGDSRCYLLRGSQIRQLTVDHTLAGELARRGVIKPEEVVHHQWRHVVTNVLGGGSVGVQTEVQMAELQPDDRILLCSDGLTDMLDDRDIAAILAAEKEPKPACERLIVEANARGGKDNVTAIVACFETA